LYIELIETNVNDFLDECHQTYIGPVLISVNPFKQLQIYTDKEINIYQGCVSVADANRGCDKKPKRR